MPNYQEFLRMARERRAKGGVKTGDVVFTRHAEFKMKQYGLSTQRVRTVIRNPKRREEGVAKDTIAVMQPGSVRRKEGKETWNQEIWVMFQTVKRRRVTVKSRGPEISASGNIRVISAWRYPGISPQGNPIPEEILREIEEGSILEMDII
ncbi:MAG: hypothetical protein HGA31_01380 [Candidatus Moranbacteria bacterium]|nr:hypothetical protein [Candidatus Moranbacteria bacterium]